MLLLYAQFAVSLMKKILTYRVYAAVFQGCMDSLQDFLREHLIILGAVGIGLCSLQVKNVRRY